MSDLWSVVGKLARELHIDRVESAANAIARSSGALDQLNLTEFFGPNVDSELVKNLKEKWLSNLESIVKNNMSVIIICRSGRRSGIVSKLLDEGANYSNVYNASGGILSWINSNNKTVKPN